MSDYIGARLKGYFQILFGATPLPRRGFLKFQGNGCSVVDDPATGTTVVSVPAGGSADGSGTGQTIGTAGPLLVATLAIAAGTRTRVQVDILGTVIADVSRGYSRSYHVSTWRVGAGTVQIGDTDELSQDIHASVSDVVLTIQGVGDRLQVLVTGSSGDTIDWKVNIKVLA